MNIAKKGKTTIRHLASSMIAQDTATEKILSMYDQVSSDPDKKKENAIKLLLRCKKMFDARAHARRILALIIKRETMKESTKVVTRESIAEEIAHAQRLLTLIKSFVDEHRIFVLREVFVFRGRNLLRTVAVEISSLQEQLRQLV